MKKLLACLLICMFILPLGYAHATNMISRPEFPSKLMIVPLFSEDSPYYDSFERNPTQPCYVQVTILQEQADGSILENYLSIHAYTIEFQYEVTFAEGMYTGIRLALVTYPTLHEVSSPSHPINIELNKVSPPTLGGIQLGATSYAAIIYGGSYTLTYDTVIKYDKHGNQVSIDPQRVTTTRAYYYQITGP